MTSDGPENRTGPQDQPQFGQGPFAGGPQDQAGPGAPGYSPYGQGGTQYGPPPGGYAPPYGGMPYARPGRGTNGLAIAALCCGIGFVIAGPFASIPAVILGFMSLGQIQRTGEDGRGMAMTGVVLGFVGIALTLLIVIFFIGIASSVSSNTGG